MLIPLGVSIHYGEAAGMLFSSPWESRLHSELSCGWCHSGGRKYLAGRVFYKCHLADSGCIHVCAAIYFAETLPSFTDAFESMSGLTTTGANVLSMLKHNPMEYCSGAVSSTGWGYGHNRSVHCRPSKYWGGSARLFNAKVQDRQ